MSDVRVSQYAMDGSSGPWANGTPWRYWEKTEHTDESTGGTDMKKIGRLVLIFALVLILLPCAARGESKDEYKTAIDDALVSMEDAFSAGDRNAARAATQAAVNTVYQAMKYLAKIMEYDDRAPSLVSAIIYAYTMWNDDLDYSSYMEQAFKLNQWIFIGGGGSEGESHYISLWADPAVLSGPGYTAIEFDISQNCDRFDGHFSAGSVTRNGHEIPVKVYYSNVPGQGGNGDEFDVAYAKDMIYAYIDEADYQAASPGTYTGSLSCSMWGMDGGDGHVYTIRVMEEIKLTLVKPGEATEYGITAEVSPEGSGTVSGTGVFYPNEPLVLTAEAVDGYRFVNWTENGSVVSTDVNCTLTATADRHLVANFEEYVPELTSVTVTPPTRTQYNTGEALNTAGMVVTAHYADGSSKDVTSSAVLSGFDSSAAGTVNVFASYTEGGITESATFPVVIIEPVGRDITIDLAAEPDDNAGTVSGAGTYPMNTFVTITAAPKEHYTFAGWKWNGETVSTDASYTFCLTANYDNALLKACFEPVPAHTITAQNCFVSLSGDDPTPLTSAEPGTRLFIWWDDTDEPEGMFWTGFFSVTEDELPEYVYEFTMPAQDVTVAAVYLPQETCTVDLSAGPAPFPDAAAFAIGDTEWDGEGGFGLLDLDGDERYDLKVILQDDGPLLVSPLSGMTLLAPSYTKDISAEHGMIGTVVFRFNPSAFDDLAGEGTLLVLPAELDTVEAGAFEGDPAFTAVDAGHCRALGAEAFKGCDGLKVIRLPGDCVIDEHAFDRCESLYAIYGPAGGDTQAWAEAHHILFIGE